MPRPLRSLLPVLVLGAALAWASSASPAVGAGTNLRSSHPAAWVAKKRPKHRRARKPTLGDRAARVALRAVGVPYRWGGASPSSGFDCSGLVYWTYGRLGISVPHSSYGLFARGRRVAGSRLKPGDLLFFYGLGHVGIYVGRGRMVHAPGSGRSVEVVNLRRSYYGRVVGARRLVRA